MDRRLTVLVLIAVLPSCGGSSGGTTPNTLPPPVAQATATPVPPTPTPVPPTPTPQAGPRPTATPSQARGTCNGVQAPNRCDVGSGSPPATARCNDGLWSCSQTRQGTCSTHGGVQCYVCPGPLC